MKTGEVIIDILHVLKFYCRNYNNFANVDCQMHAGK